ncbi:MAG: phosphoglycerate kinase [Chloroflexi bacterium]|nr:phosphoglycerate kinase [Chloroflexota bacterium]
MLTVRDVAVAGKRVLVRVDFNVPLDKKTGGVADDARIRAALPTIHYLLNNGAGVVLCSHLGRPDGQVVEGLRMAPAARRLSQLLDIAVPVAPDCVGLPVEEMVSQLKEGSVMMLENLRFHPEEEKNDPQFAQSLARLADLYVNDAFGTAHRAHASTSGVASYLPAVAGLLMEKEVEYLGRLLTNPEPPFAAILGGAKVSDKVAVLEQLIARVDALLLGGAMACTFLKAEGLSVGRSRVEEDRLDFARSILDKAERRGVVVIMPRDVVVADEISPQAVPQVVAVEKVPSDKLILDVGPETIAAFTEELRNCKTVLWNGPLGVFEMEPFAQGTRALARLLAGLKATTIVGGGETVAAVESLGLGEKITHLSTGGGATLEFLEGRRLPGVAALLDRQK